MANHSSQNRHNRNAPAFHNRRYGPEQGAHRRGAGSSGSSVGGSAFDRLRGLGSRMGAGGAGAGGLGGTGRGPGAGGAFDRLRGRGPGAGPGVGGLGDADSGGLGSIGLGGGSSIPGGLGSAGGGPFGDGALITRRRLLFGAAGLGAAAVIGGVIALNSGNDDGNVTYLNVPEEELVPLADLEALETYKTSVHTIASFDLPINSLVWVNDDNVAACLLPTESGSPLAKIGILGLGTGLLTTVLDKAIGAEEHFEIYDVRATASGAIWTEANILEGIWRVYSAPLAGTALGAAQMLEEGDSTLEMPTLAAVGGFGYWQVLPKSTEQDAPSSRLMKAAFGSAAPITVLENPRRMCTPPYATADSVVVTQRLESSTMYYQMVNINAANDQITDSLTLPASMHPLEAGYGTNGFMFSFSDIYSYGGAISNLGTYTPMARPGNGDYSSVQWFGFTRTPTAPPAWCGHLLIVKSSYSVCGIDLASRSYFAIDVDSGADVYGDYLATSGTRNTFVTYANLDYTPVGKDPVKICRVKVWTLGASEDAYKKEGEDEDGEKPNSSDSSEGREDANSENVSTDTAEGEGEGESAEGAGGEGGGEDYYASEADTTQA